LHKNENEKTARERKHSDSLVTTNTGEMFLCGTRILRVIHGRDARATSLGLTAFKVENPHNWDPVQTLGCSISTKGLPLCSAFDREFRVGLQKSGKANEILEVGQEGLEPLV
jgi:hypothetical protein